MSIAASIGRGEGMRIDPRWAWLLQDGSKFGIGLQGPDHGTLVPLNASKALYMDGDIDLYGERYGDRGALRLYHGTEKNWQDWRGWARHCAYHMARVYGYGCRDMVPLNEVFGIEGLSDDEDAYRWMGLEWTPAFLNALEAELHALGLPLWPERNGVRLWLFGPAPGHNYEDGHVGLTFLAPAFRDARIFGSIEHYYWEPDGGFLDGQWWIGPERLLKVRAKMLELGIDKPVWIGEWNRKIDRGSEADIRAYAEQCKRFIAWCNSLPFVVWATNFLGCCNDTSYDFMDLTLNRTPGLVEMLSDGWDCQSEGEWASAPDPQPEPQEDHVQVEIGNHYLVTDLRSTLPRRKEYPQRELSAIKYLVIHHSAVAVDSTADSIARYHVEQQGWPGIGYQWIVHQDGRTEYCQDLSRVSYNVAGRNGEVVGICLPGDWTNGPPPAAQLLATRRLVAELQYALGWFVPVVGHRDIALPGYETACPGATWPTWSESVTVKPDTTPVPAPVYRFVLGFADLANALGAAVVGQPAENEHPATVQETSTGFMIWTPGQPSRFVRK